MPTKADRLAAELHAVCRLYFPRWRLASTWTLKDMPAGRWKDARGAWHITSESGYCDRMTKTIGVQVARATSERRITIIHECCHAVTTGSHGPRFLARMRQASEQAERCGEPDIAQALRQEVAHYEALVGSTALSARAVSQRIEMILGGENPTFTCDEVIQRLADEQGSTGPEILTYYPRLPQVYAQTKRRLLRTFRTQLATVRAAHVQAVLLAQVEAHLVPLVQALAGESVRSD